MLLNTKYEKKHYILFLFVLQSCKKVFIKILLVRIHKYKINCVKASAFYLELYQIMMLNDGESLIFIFQYI